ncbi:hypothetical protein [Antarcticimicrobium luteum]|uniref:hypothetical protein n=1 Tax=Antarcticimicrobium luteum TaxID=2547397 RepID=UPI0014077272|nr:hypothetical protein [Antarcticimicrobium luteum]
MRYLIPLLLSAGPALAFERPIPQPQTEAAEFWFLIASLMLVTALFAVHWMVNRR